MRSFTRFLHDYVHRRYPPPFLLLAYCKRFTAFLLACVLIFAGATGAKEEAIKQGTPQQGVELLFPAGTGKHAKGAKLSKKEKLADALLKKLKAIEKGGDANAVDKLGQTALMYAAAANNRLAVCWLVAKGADATIKNEKGETAAELAKDKQIQEFLTVISRVTEPLNEEEKEISARFFTKGNEGAMASPTNFRPARGRAEKPCTLTELGVLLRNPQIKIESDWLSYSHRQKQLTPEVMSIYLRRGTLDIATKDEKGESVWIAPDFKSSSITLACALGVVPQSPEKKLLVALTSDNMALVEQLIKETPALINSPFIRQHGKEKISLPLLCFASSRNMIDLLYKLGIDDSDSVIPENERNLYYYENRREFIVLELIERVPTENMDEVLTCLKGHGWQLPQFCLHYVLKEDGANLTRPEREKKALLLIKAGANINAEMGYLKETPLHLAAVDDFPSIAAMLIKKGANVNAALAGGGSAEGITPLHLAESTEMATILLEAGANPNAIDSSGMTPLSHARKETILPLVKAGANVNAKDGEGRTPLFNAQGDSISLLLKAGADVNITNNEGKTPLVDAVLWAKNAADITPFIEAGLDVNAKDKYGRTPLFFAGEPSVASALIQAGADPNAKNNNNETPLFYVKGEVITVLVNAGADVHIKDNLGRTPIFPGFRAGGWLINRSLEDIKTFARHGLDINAQDNRGNTALVNEGVDLSETQIQALLEAGVNPNTKNKKGVSPLQWYQRYSSDRIMKLLKKHGAKEETVALPSNKKSAPSNEKKNDPNEKDARGRTRLMLVVLKKGSEGEIQSLLRQGADVNARDNDGNTALHYLLTAGENIDARLNALLAAHPDVNLATHKGTTPLMILDVCRDPKERVSRVKKLLELHAKVDLKDAVGKTAAMRYVEKDDNAEALKLLLDAGANPKLRNKDGKTLLQLAQQLKRTACIRLLQERLTPPSPAKPLPASSSGHLWWYIIGGALLVLLIGCVGRRLRRKK